MTDYGEISCGKGRQTGELLEAIRNKSLNSGMVVRMEKKEGLKKLYL